MPGAAGRRGRAGRIPAERQALEVEQLPLGPYGTNCYVAFASGSTRAVVVDPGDQPERVLRLLAERRLRADGILVTHGHWDHLGAVAGVARAAGAEVWMPRGEAELLRALASAPYQPEHLLEGGERVALAGIDFATFPVPGHSPASIAYAAAGHVFSGDVLFAGSIGRTDLNGGDLPTLLASVERLADALGPDTVVHPGHGPATTLGRELATNPFLTGLRR